jgi:hypothetical protein
MNERMLDLRALTVTIVQHYGITSGYWNLSVGFGLGVTSIATPESEGPYPTGFAQVVSVGIREVTDPKEMNKLTVDASDVTRKIESQKASASPPKGE